MKEKDVWVGSLPSTVPTAEHEFYQVGDSRGEEGRLTAKVDHRVVGPGHELDVRGLPCTRVTRCI